MRGKKRKETHLLILLASLILALAFLFPESCRADEWKKADYLLEGSWIALHVLNWGTTLDIADNPGRYHEMNPIMGRHPSRGRVNLYFAGTTVAHVLTSALLPKKWREYFQVGSIAVTGGCLGWDLSLGLKIKF